MAVLLMQQPDMKPGALNMSVCVPLNETTKDTTLTKPLLFANWYFAMIK